MARQHTVHSAHIFIKSSSKNILWRFVCSFVYAEKLQPASWTVYIKKYRESCSKIAFFSHNASPQSFPISCIQRESWRHAKFQLPLGYVTHDMGAKNTNHNQTLSCTNLFTWIALNLFFLPSYRVYRILEFLCMCVWETLCTNLPPVNIACVSIYSHIFTKIHFYYIFLYFVCWDDLTRFSPSLHSISKCKIWRKKTKPLSIDFTPTHLIYGDLLQWIHKFRYEFTLSYAWFRWCY